MSPRPQLVRPLAFWLFLSGAFVVCLLVAASWGAPVSILDMSSGGEKSEIARRIFLELRPPRLVAAILVGANLALAGVALQTLFRNPLAEPYLLGISSGGALGATLAAAFALPVWIFFDSTALCALVGALGAACAVYALGRGRAFDSARLLLVGVAVSAFLTALMSLVVTLSGQIELFQRASFWLLGGLTRASWSQNFALLLAFVGGGFLLLSSARDLNALRAGGEDAAILGVQTERLARKILLAASLLAGFSVAAAGLIGFIGLMGPHLVRLGARKFGLGGDLRRILPASAVGGATLLLGCDALARSAFAPTEVPVGIFTALLGVPLFLVLARRI